jgi:hypothetical protein
MNTSRMNITAAIVAALVVLTGCTVEVDSKSDPKPMPSETTASASSSPASEPATAEPEPEPTTAKPEPKPTRDVYEVGSAERDALYLKVLREEYPLEFASVPDDLMMETGHAMCELLDMGGTFPMVFQGATEAGYSREAAAFYIGTTIGALCPRHKGLFE